MFCKKCGKELDDNAKFCDGCGEQQQALLTPLSAESVNAIMNDGKQIIKKFFSPNPASALIEAGSSNSKMGVVLIAINVLLFAFVSCFNITQVINHMIKAATSAITSTANSMLGGALGSALTGSAIPEVHVPILFDLLLPLALFALVIAAVLFAGIYIIFKLKKQPNKNFFVIANVIGVSGLPIAAALAVNFILGFILPQLTIFVFIAATLTSLVTLYEGFKSIFEVDNAPVIEFAILIAVICIVFAITSGIALAQVGDFVKDTTMKAATNGFSGLSGMFGSLFG